MKKLLLLALMAIFALEGSAQSKNTITIQTNASRNCQTCETRFKDNVPFFKGVKEYTYDKATAKLTVTYDTQKTNPEQLRKQISNLGYHADNVPANAEARAKLPACCRSEKTDSCKGHAGGCKGQSGSCKSHAGSCSSQGEHKCHHK